MASPTFFVGGSTPNSNDNTWTVLMKILGATIDGGGGGGGGVAPGVVDPNGNVTGSPGDTYWNSANGTFWVKQSGTGTDTGWSQVV